MPRIFYCDMENFKHLYEECVSLLPEERRQKAERIINKNQALLSATAGLMMKEVLRISEDGMIKFGEHGKPFLEHGPCFSISHSRRYSVLAVSENSIGIDIEMHEMFNEQIAKRCFTEEEQDYFRRGKNAHSHAAPKGATPQEYAKATGLETLFGALFLSGQTQRLNQLFALILEARHGL